MSIQRDGKPMNRNSVNGDVSSVRVKISLKIKTVIKTGTIFTLDHPIKADG